MFLTVTVLLLIVAFILFLLATFGVPTRINLVALGLALWVLVILLGNTGVVLK